MSVQILKDSAFDSVNAQIKVTFSDCQDGDFGLIAQFKFFGNTA